MLGLCSVSSAFVLPGRHQLATRGASVRMATDPGEVWESYKAVVAATTEYKAEPSVDSALALCRVAATSREADPDTVCEAMLTVEKGMRDTAKADGGELSRSTLQSLDGAWRLVFTTGTVEMQSKLGRKIDYFPLRATQTFDTRTNAITNGIYVGSFALVRFFGSFEWRTRPVHTYAPGASELSARTGHAHQPAAHRTYVRHTAAGAPRHAHTARAPASGACRTLCGAHRGRGLPGRGVPGRGPQGVACLALPHGVCSTVSKGLVWRAAGSRSAAASSSTSTASRCSACPLSSCPRRGAGPGLEPGLGL